MKKFDFTLVITGLDPSDETLEDRLYKAGCSDALVCVIDGNVELDFTREAESLDQAIKSAEENLTKAGAKVLKTLQVS